MTTDRDIAIKNALKNAIEALADQGHTVEMDDLMTAAQQQVNASGEMFAVLYTFDPSDLDRLCNEVDLTSEQMEAACEKHGTEVVFKEVCSAIDDIAYRALDLYGLRDDVSDHLANYCDLFDDEEETDEE